MWVQEVCGNIMLKEEEKKKIEGTRKRRYFTQIRFVIEVIYQYIYFIIRCQVWTELENVLV